MSQIPQRVFLTRGKGVHRHQLTAFEYALRDADIEQQNLVSVSSILPPGCELIAREDGVAALQPGEITYCVLARSETNEPGRRISAGPASTGPLIRRKKGSSAGLTSVSRRSRPPNTPFRPVNGTLRRPG